MSKVANQINKALDNNVVELYGMSQSGKSSIAHEIAKKYPATLWIDSLFQYNFDGEYYLAQTSSLDDIGEIMNEFNLLIIDDFFSLKGRPRDNMYKIQEFIYNNKKLSVLVINQVRHNFNENSSDKYKPFADYIMQKYADRRFYVEFKDGKTVVTQTK